MNRYLIGLGLALTMFVSSGCGTIANTTQGNNYVYGGVGANLNVVGDAMSDEEATFMDRSSTVMMATMDIPFSFIGDTILLPVNATADPAPKKPNAPTPGLLQ